MSLLALALALHAGAQAPASAAIDAIDFDLALYGIPDFESGLGTQRCQHDDDPTVITVCAHRSGGAYPMRQMEHIYGPERLVAETRIAGNLRGAVHVQSANLNPASTGSSLPHETSNRVLVGMRLPF